MKNEVLEPSWGDRRAFGALGGPNVIHAEVKWKFCEPFGEPFLDLGSVCISFYRFCGLGIPALGP